MTEEKTVQLKEKRIISVWECYCGGQVFWAREDGRLECDECRTLVRGLYLSNIPPWAQEDDAKGTV